MNKGVTGSTPGSPHVQVIAPLYDEAEGGHWTTATIIAASGMIEVRMDDKEVVLVKVANGEVQVCVGTPPRIGPIAMSGSTGCRG